MRKGLITDLLLNCVLPIIVGVLIYMGSQRYDYPSFISGHLADLFWAYAYASAILLVWTRELNIVWFFTALLSSYFFEWGQYTGIFAGVGDWMDVFVYSVGFAVALVLNKIIKLWLYKNL